MKQIKLLVVICLTFIINQPLWANNYQQGENTMHINKPYLVLGIDFAGCSYVPSVNGVTFEEMLGGEKGVIATDIPINQWLKPGKNEFSLILKPSKNANKLKNMDQNCKAKVILKVKPNDTSITPDDSNYTPIFSYEYHSAPDNITTDESHFKGTTQAGQLDSSQDFKRVEEGGDIKIGPVHIEKIDTDHGPGIKMTREVDLPLPFPKWAWFDGDQIPNNEETKKELTKQYRKIWEALKHNNIQSFSSDFKQRDEEYAQAMYKSVNKINIISKLTQKEKSQTLELGDFQPKYQHLKVFGNGKLAKLLSWDDLPVIFFNEKHKDMSHSVDITFMKKNGHWQIIR